MILHENGKLTQNQCSAISALKSHKELLTSSKDLDLPSISADIAVLKTAVQCNLSEHDFEEYYWQVSQLSFKAWPV